MTTPSRSSLSLLTAPLLGGTIASVRTLRLLRLLRLAKLSRRVFTMEGVRAAGLLAIIVFIGAGEAFSQLEPHGSLVGALAERFVRPDIDRSAAVQRELAEGSDDAIQAELADIAARVTALQATLAGRR